MRVIIENARSTTVIETENADDMAFLLDVLGHSADTEDIPMPPPPSDCGGTMH